MSVRARRGLDVVVLGIGVAALVVVCWRPPALAQAPPAPSPSPGVTVIPAVETELLRIEAVVTDGQGRPVTNLEAADFLVLEDGQPQALTHFQGAASSAPAPSAAPAAPAVVRTVDARPAGSHIVLAIDDLHLSTSSILACKEALKRFVVEQITDEDQVAVVTTSGNIGLFQAFTRERAVLNRAIERLAYRERRATNAGRATMSEREAEAIEGGDAEALRLATQEISLRDMLSVPMQNPRAEREARSQARGMAAQALDITHRTLSTLEGVVRSLGPVSGRKLLVLVSDGFLTGEGTKDPSAFDMRRVFDASARAGVSVYALHSRGLTAAPPGGDASEPGQVEHSSLATRDGYRLSADVKERNSMSFLAEGTGGFLVHGTNDLSTALGRILRDSAAAYLLAYSPSQTARDGRFRAIEVKLQRHPGYTVRSRKGYFAPDARKPAAAAAAKPGPAAAQKRDVELRDALGSLVPLRGVPIQLSADFVDLPPDGLQLKVRGRLELGGVPFIRDGDRRRADLDLVGVVYGENGELVGEVDSYHADLNLTEVNYERLLQDGLRYEKSVALKPGLYQVRLAARESASSLVGSATQWVQVPALKGGSLSLSSVFLFADPAGRAPAEKAELAEVQALRLFPAGGSLYFRLYAYNPTRDGEGRTDVVLQSQVWSAGKLQGASPAEPVVFADPAASAQPVAGRITLEGLAPGEYELRVLLVDRKANANVLRRVSFTVG